MQVVYSFYCQNPYSHMKCLFTKIQSNIAIWQCIAIHLNTIRNMALTRIVSPLLCSQPYRLQMIALGMALELTITTLKGLYSQ